MVSHVWLLVVVVLRPDELPPRQVLYLAPGRPPVDVMMQTFMRLCLSLAARVLGAARDVGVVEA